MDTSTLVETLRNAGLSPYQADAYVTLLELGRVSAQELATASDVPGPRIYDVLAALEAEGYVVTYERDQLYVEARDPEDGLDSLLTRVSEFQDAIAEIESRWTRPRETPIDVSVVKQFQTVLGAARERIVATDHQIFLALRHEQYLALRSELRSAYRRGVAVQIVLHTAADTDADVDLSAELFDGTCSEVRLGETPCMYEPFLTIVDGETVCFGPFRRPDPRDGARGAHSAGDPELRYGVVVTDPVTAYVYEWYFLAALWEPSQSVYSARSQHPPIEFVDIRELVRVVDPLLRDGAEVVVRVEGRRVSTGRRQTFSGCIVSVRSDTSESPDGTPMRSLLTREATVVVETADGTVTVGGKGAVTEDVEAARLVVTEVRE
jgi:sugar-specific transcriptional regulator TrmB